MAETLIDSWTSYSAFQFLPLKNLSTYNGSSQSFVCSYSGLQLSSCKWILQRILNPTGNIYAKLYTINGTASPGSGDNYPKTLLVTSDPVAANSIPTDSEDWITFNFSTSYALNNGTWYCISVEYIDGDASNYIRSFGLYNTYSAGGNGSYNVATSWYSDTHANPFYVYGNVAATSQISKVAGVSQASIKTVYPTALASIKKLSGVSNS